MANKFQKSVLERLEQEQKKNRLNQKPIVVQMEQKSVTEKNSVDSPILPQSIIEKGNVESSSGLLEYLQLESVRQAKNKTFYLDIAVIEAVRAEAKKAGVADSKLVNDILRTVLGLRD